MASQLTQWGAAQLLAITFGVADVPEHYWVALAGTQPAQRGDGSMLANLEPPITSGSTTYARQSVPVGDSYWSLSSSGFIGNLDVIDFGVPDVNWGYMPYYALCDAAENGNVYGYGQFSNPQQMTDQFWVRMPPGAITIRAVALQPSIVT